MTFKGNEKIELEATLEDAPAETDTPLPIEERIVFNLSQSSNNANYNLTSSLSQHLAAEKSDGIIKAIGKELLLNIFIPERLLLNAKAAFYITLAFTICSFEYDEMLSLLRIIMAN